MDAALSEVPVTQSVRTPADRASGVAARIASDLRAERSWINRIAVTASTATMRTINMARKLSLCGWSNPPICHR